MRFVIRFVFICFGLCFSASKAVAELPSLIHWVSQFGTPQTDVPREIFASADGKSFIVGQSGEFNVGAGFGGLDGYVASIDATGTQQWIVQLGKAGTDSATGVVVDDFGNSYVAWVSVSGGNTADGYLSKIDSTGTVLWTQDIDVNTRTLPQDLVVGWVILSANILAIDKFTTDRFTHLWLANRKDGCEHAILLHTRNSCR